ncbi:hypothetical protein [Crocosphaera sp. XPORK-15E]|uniref:hypothetical protein n=1 Tax=Crocosphaera sp. XPORK-15E TaxID=3110247 RepID=UPI002B1FCF35|nr:hypothetical protein [Crocosphaera sp. XPORK-15E]MEA5537169.1 hypothetical protein [Crocosphaera sp. XPORK-15E]
MLVSRKGQKNSVKVAKYVPKLSEAKQLEAEQKKNVLILVENLVEREEATFKMIIDCLYDVGSVNLINKKFRFRPLNKMMKLVARLSKRGFRTVAIYWVKKNSPEIITDFLIGKVRF